MTEIDYPLDQAIPTSVTDDILFSPPFLSVEGAFNLRRLNIALPCYRAAELSQVTPAGAQQLYDCGIRDIFDLRTHVETERRPAAKAIVDKGIQIHSVPVVGSAMIASDSMAKIIQRHAADPSTQPWVDDYHTLCESGTSAFATIFRHILEHPQSPFLFNCTAGKDRTGITAVLLSMLAGLSDEEIAQDYALTRVGIEPRRQMILSFLTTNPSETSEATVTGRLRLASSRALCPYFNRKQVMLDFLQSFKSRYGSIDKFCTEHIKLTEEDLGKLKQLISNS